MRKEFIKCKILAEKFVLFDNSTSKVITFGFHFVKKIVQNMCTIVHITMLFHTFLKFNDYLKAYLSLK